MVRKANLAFVLCALLSACGPAGETALLREAHDAVLKQLKDPESARFDDDGTRIYVKNGLVCGGTVNAKNSYGGYAGEQDYFYKRGSGAILAVDDHLNVIDMMGECSSALTASINASPKSK